ncbi:MAG: HipA family kinase [Clostridium sp.]|nr:HipA family kinase [Clostridium sp.]
MILINELKIAQLCNNISIGSTEPKFAILEDGTQVITKLMNGPEGNLVLFNEYLCYRLAILLDIPMPRSGICVFDDTTEIQDPEIATSDNFGKAFYSEFMPKTTKLLQTIISKIRNKEDFYKIILFDHIVFNTDRNAGNLLVKFYKDDISLKVIDHTHVFINQTFWDSNCLKRAIEENDLLNTKVLEYNKYLYDMFIHNISVTKESLEKESLIFKERINSHIILQIIDTIPEEWKPKQKDIEALIDYIMYRIENIDTIISTILTYIK